MGCGAEYDWRDDPAGPRRESGATRPATLYGVAKNATREVLAAWLPIPFVWGRVFDLSGAGEAPGRLVASLLATLRTGEQFSCRHGQLRRDYLAVEDVGAALAHLTASAVTGPVNIASGIAVPLGDLARLAAAHVGRPDLLNVETRPAAPLLMQADVTRLRQEVGCLPPLPLRERILVL